MQRRVGTGAVRAGIRNPVHAGMHDFRQEGSAVAYA
ncbi:hypothetical protein XAP412_290080 [Xanthomonas phaseoli pv. phaseoli]|nr:hypothetical protein XAP412_290080 [Xanthomonas phaseoli pv. phaseoli]SOO27344.1 hypothetical protein XAP6164_1510032 [Xanthomonas phaseoli pv. phaseoli]